MQIFHRKKTFGELASELNWDMEKLEASGKEIIELLNKQGLTPQQQKFVIVMLNHTVSKAFESWKKKHVAN